MKKRIAGLILALLTVMLCVPAAYTQNVYAATGTANVTAGASSIISGENITVNVDINSSTDIFVAQFQLVYDNSLFDFVSTTGPAATSSPAGVIPFQYDGDITKHISFDVVFKAKAVGTGSFSITEPVFVGMDGDKDVEIEMTCSSSSVQVMAVGSDDATLSSLQVAGAGLTPEFAKWTMNYTCYVDNSVTSVNIGAVASQGGKVEVGGNFANLAVGGNNITVTSYAPNGKTMTYTINVVRLEPPTEPPATEPPTTTEPETTLAPIEGGVTVNGVKYTIDSGYSSDIIPTGFDADVLSYNGEDVLAAVNAKYNATLLYLVDGDGKGSFFLYDSENKSFFPYIEIDSGLHRYILADGSNEKLQPSGCKQGKITVGGVTFDALISEENGDFAYFYALSDRGTAGWYCYDKTENTVQRMFIVDMGKVPESTASNETPAATVKPDATEDGRLNSLENANNDLRKDYSQLKKTRNLIIAIAAVLLVVMLVIIVVMAAHKSEKKRALDVDTDDFADEEDEIDRAEAELAAGDSAEEAAEDSQEYGRLEDIPQPVEEIPEEDMQPSEEIPEGEAQPSEEIPEGEAQPSEDMPEGEVQPSEEIPEGEAQPSEDMPEGEAQPSEEIPEGEAQPSENMPEEEMQPSEEIPEWEAQLSEDDAAEETPLSEAAAEETLQEPEGETEAVAEDDGIEFVRITEDETVLEDEEMKKRGIKNSGTGSITVMDVPFAGDITEEEIEAFEREAAALDAASANEEPAVQEEEQAAGPEPDAPTEASGEAQGAPEGRQQDGGAAEKGDGQDDGIEIIDADGEDDFFL